MTSKPEERPDVTRRKTNVRAKRGDGFRLPTETDRGIGGAGGLARGGPRNDRLPGERPGGRWSDRIRRSRDLPGVMRLMAPDEAAEYAAHLRRLDTDARRRRFSRDVDDRFIDRFVEAIDWTRALVLGYVEAGRVRGAVQLAWPEVAWLKGAAELAVQVEAGWRRRGIGAGLIARARCEAEARGLAGITFFAQADNEPMLELVRGAAVPLRYTDGEAEGWIELSDGPMRV